LVHSDEAKITSLIELKKSKLTAIIKLFIILVNWNPLHAFIIILLVVSFLILLSIILSKYSGNLGVPSLVLFILIGMLAGSDGPGKIYFDDFKLTQSIGIVALVFIMFSGGLETKWSTTKKVLWSGVSLASIGVLIAAAGVGLTAHFFFGIDIYYSLLLGAVISSTDAAAVFSVLGSKNINLKGKVKPLLEFESGSNDPMAVFLTITLIEVIVNKSIGPGGILFSVITQFGIGLAAGYILGRLLVVLMNKMHLQFENLYVVFTIAFVTFIFALTTFLNGSGFLAVYIAAIIVGNSEFVQKRSLRRFFSGIAQLSQIIMFLALGLLCFPSQLMAVIVPGLIFSAVLMFVVRPFSVFVSLLFSKFTFKEKSFISWVGLRGSVPIILSTFPVIAGIDNSMMLFNLIFFMTITSALVQGWSIPFVARIHGLDSDEKKEIKMPLEISTEVKTKNDLVDVIIPFNSSIAGKNLAELNFPEGSLITVIFRDNEYIVPSGSTSLEEGDVVLILLNKENRNEAIRILTEIK